MRSTLFLLLTLLLASCRTGVEEVLMDPPSAALEEFPSPAGAGSGEPNLFVAEDGAAYLTWIEAVDDSTDALLFSVWRNGRWSEARRVAAGGDWFVNWADFPSLAVYPESGALAAHWLAKAPQGETYDYNVLISQSADGGNTWGTPFLPHTDGVPAEHGFVTLLPLAPDRMMAVWLDGRHTKEAGAGPVGQEREEGHEGHGGAMTLRTATFDPAGVLYDEAGLDHRVCDCCQTDAALTPGGPVVVYRDRSGEEIRDIYFTRKVEGRWTEPRPVFSDNWRIAACPVNGPAVAAAGELIAVAWFTGAQDSARVKIAFSRNGGATFDPPIRIDGGRPAGRVDVVLSDSGVATVSWLENREQGAEIRAARVALQGMLGPPRILTATSESRRSGFPVLARAGEELLLAWTRVDSSGATAVRVGKVLF